MSNFFRKLFHIESNKQPACKIDRGYVSEYTHFIDRFLEEHPEVLLEQHDGRLLYWDKRVDLVALEKAEQDRVSDDGYGFHSSAWHAAKH